MKIRKYPITYWAISSEKLSPGINNKIKDFVESCKDLGYESNHNIVEPGNYFKYIKSLLRILRYKNRILILRYNNMLGLPLFIISICIRARGNKLIFDIPTPIKNHIIYNINKKNKKIRNYIEIINAVLLGPIPFLFANLLIDYAREGKYFRLFSNEKSLLIGNGIRTQNWPIPEESNRINSINLIGVGAIASWHGWDKVIYAIGECKKINPKLEVNFKIIGSGDAEQNLKALVKNLQLTDVIHFLGMKNKNQLICLYKESNIAVGTLGWDEIGVSIASPLKHREYLANGIPFLYSTDDPDIDIYSKYAYKITPTIENIANFLLNIDLSKIPKKKECRNFCNEKMDYIIKIPEILERLKND